MCVKETTDIEMNETRSCLTGLILTFKETIKVLPCKEILTKCYLHPSTELA